MFARLKSLACGKVPNMSLSFFGMGVLQAWLFAVQTMARVHVEVSYGWSDLLPDLGSLPIFLLFLLFAGRLAPIPRNAFLVIAGPFSALVGTALVGVSYVNPELPAALPFSGLVVVGCGIGLIVLRWWETLAALGSIEVALYYAGSWVIGEAISFVLAGFSAPYYLGAAAVLPILSVGMLEEAEARLASRGLEPQSGPGAISFPWKPVSLIVLYDFAYGCGTWVVFYQDNLAMHLGTLLPAVAVCASILFSTSKFNFATMYRIILPAAIAGLGALLLTGTIGQEAVTVFVRSSHTAVFIYTAVLFCSLSRRYRTSAAWLFSLFNVAHIASLGFGTILFN